MNMATAPRRETMIALQARRTSHQVATAAYLHEHVRPLLQRCQSCGNEFAPLDVGQECCPQCATKPNAVTTNVVVEESPQALVRGRASLIVSEAHDAPTSRTIITADTLAVIAIFAILVAYIVFALWTATH
jgi:uncharacterized protein (UPF0212 family)